MERYSEANTERPTHTWYLLQGARPRTLIESELRGEHIYGAEFGLSAAVLDMKSHGRLVCELGLSAKKATHA